MACTKLVLSVGKRRLDDDGDEDDDDAHTRKTWALHLSPYNQLLRHPRDAFRQQVFPFVVACCSSSWSKERAPSECQDYYYIYVYQEGGRIVGRVCL